MRRGRRGGCASPYGDRAVGVWLVEPLVGRPPSLTGDQAEAVPALRLLVSDALLSGLDPHPNCDAYGERLQQPLPARHNG